MLTSAAFPPCASNPPSPSLHMRNPRAGRLGDLSFAMTELISPLLSRAWSSSFKSSFVLLDDFSQCGWWFGKEGDDAPAVCTVCRRWTMLVSFV